ncbi:hypothetical protein [Streptoalloteichus hindustanus]|uniref:Uncharacterized protein n=1 Tax=Streptoalloteichus hindustanus TaxID=2017 RepID=A0A1M5APE2_STRHI|nr:hypothetical protein [Streptoalloteichus hindustanus]SHF32045.1 hypothetical protein SAMN05444320_103206 [Streptoalloteichus hindustanus]
MSDPSAPRARPVVGVLLASAGCGLVWTALAAVFGVVGVLGDRPKSFGSSGPFQAVLEFAVAGERGWLPPLCALLGVSLVVAGVLQAVPRLPLPARFAGWPARLVGALSAAFGLAVWCDRLWPSLTARPGPRFLSQERFADEMVTGGWGQLLGLLVAVGAAAHVVAGTALVLRGGPGAGHRGEETESDGRGDREDGGGDA